jgi:hypothetical protein
MIVGQPTPVFGYVSFIRKIVFDQDPARVFDIHRHPQVIRYASSEKYCAVGNICAVDGFRRNDLARELGMDAEWLLTWTLCRIHPERIKELSIPLTDIERYIHYLDQFKSLSKIIFKYENVVRFEYNPTIAGLRVGSHCGPFRAIVHLVQQHIFLHKHVLRKVVLPDSHHSTGTPRYPVENIRREIDSLLLSSPPGDPQS